MQDANALVLEVMKEGNALKMSIFQQDEFASTLRHYSQISVSFPEINILCQELACVLNRADKTGSLSIEETRNLKKIGQLLWDHLLTRPAKDKLKNARIQDLILSIDEELIHIPWEFLYCQDNFLSLKFNLGRLVRTKEHTAEPQYRSLPGTVKMLILANPTNDLKSSYQEGTFIKNQFENKRKEMSIDFKSTYIDTLYVKKNLRDYDLVHYAGHCEYDPFSPEHTGWVLSDGIFSARDIHALGEALSLPAMVFSNACSSAAGQMEADYQEKTYSMAAAFLFSGVRHYIGTIRRIEDSASLSFAREFYTQLISGKTVGECMRRSRTALIKEYGPENIWWANYLLYGDPSFALFRTKPKPAKLKAKLNLRKLLMGAGAAALAVSICIYLYMWLPSINPSNYFLLSQSRNLFLQGRNQEAVAAAGKIIQKEPLFLAAYPLIAESYQRLGDRGKALKYYFDYALYSEKKNDPARLTGAYIGIGWNYHLRGEYIKAFDFYGKALSLSRQNRDRLNEADVLGKMAVWYMDKGDNDKALELLTKSSEINRQKSHIYKHKYNLACDYFNLGLLFTNKDDYATAKEFYAKSCNLFNQVKLRYELSDYYFNLGEICLFEKQYLKAMDYYTQGLNIDEGQGNFPSMASDYTMIGELYVEMDNLAEAEKYFQQALEVCGTIDAPLEAAAAHYDLGLLYKKKGWINRAREHLRKAQEVYASIDTPDYGEVKKALLELE